jgi:hypothetical protein
LKKGSNNKPGTHFWFLYDKMLKCVISFVTLPLEIVEACICLFVGWTVQSVETVHHKTGSYRFDSWYSHGNFQVTHFFCPPSVALVSTQPLMEMSTKELPWELSAANVYSWQPCCLSCAEHHSKDGSPTFNPHSEFLWLLTGKLYFLCSFVA